MAFPTGWARKCIVTIPDAQISGSNTDFPILLTEDNFPAEMMDTGANSALNGGGDVRFSLDSAGATQLPCEIVSFITNATLASRLAEVHVKRPTLNTGADRTFYVWYKKAGEVQPLVTAPYGRNAVWSDYALVCHLNGTPIDSSGNNSPSEMGTLTTRQGPFNNSVYDFSGTNTNKGINVNSAAGDTTGDFSVNCWLVLNSTPAFGSIISRRNGGTWNYHWRMEGPQPSLLIGSSSPNDPGGNVFFGGVWKKLDLTISGTDITYYQEGVNTGTQTVSGTRTLRPGINTTIGISESLGQEVDGGIAEARIRLGVLSDGWLTTEYNNQSNPTAFATAGTPEAGGGGLTLFIQKINHNISSDMLSPVQIHSLGVNQIDHSIISFEVMATFGLTLIPNNLEHVMSSDEGVLVQTQILNISDGLQFFSGGSLSLTQIHNLIIWDSEQEISSDDMIFLQFQSLIAQNATHEFYSDVAPLFDPADFTLNTLRMQKAERANRAISSSGEPRIIHPINTRN